MSSVEKGTKLQSSKFDLEQPMRLVPRRPQHYDFGNEWLPAGQIWRRYNHWSEVVRIVRVRPAGRRVRDNSNASRNNCRAG
jgi:hypothetical protein